MFALVDCNNFYVSCERVFNPALHNKPVVVLSNNDGCIISRSDEAKNLGLKMAEPAFYKTKFLKENGVHCLSSNYTLYGDMSQRVFQSLKSLAKEVEIYSIDEAFLNVENIPLKKLEKHLKYIRQKVYRNTGIPASIGAAKTKSLAKIANKLAKKQLKHDGIYIIYSDNHRDCIIRNTPIEKIWGIGRQYSKMLQQNNIFTAYDFIQANNQWIKKNVSVVGLRIKEELMGNPCIPLELIQQEKKAIATTRAFGKKMTEYIYIKEAVATYATRCAEKLRRQNSAANILTVFIHTDPFNPKEIQYNKSKTITLPVATNNQLEIVDHSLHALSYIFKPGLRYKKAGVIVDGLIPAQHVQANIFDVLDRKKNNHLSSTADVINKKYGKDSLRLAVMGTGKEWNLRQENLSRRYTTNWNEIMRIKV
jgi:DNA polymerase V